MLRCTIKLPPFVGKHFFECLMVFVSYKRAIGEEGEEMFIIVNCTPSISKYSLEREFVSVEFGGKW